MRTIFNYSLSWTEELSRYIFIWQTWLGTSIALKYKQHIRVEILINFLKKIKNKKNIRSISEFLFGLVLVLSYYMQVFYCVNL